MLHGLPHRTFAIFTAVCAIALLGATTPLAPPLGPPLATTPPSVIVYPLQVSAPVDPSAGRDLSSELGAEITALGGVKVIPTPADPTQHDYLDKALALGADYYISGYIAPVGSMVTVVEQLVSTRYGIVVWSNSAQLGMPSEAKGQGTLIRAAVLIHANRMVASLYATPAPAPTATPTPAPRTPARVAQVTPPRPPSILDDDEDTPRTPPTTYTVLAITGPTNRTFREFAADAITRQIVKSGQSAALLKDRPTRNIQIWSDAICTETGTKVLMTGSLSAVTNSIQNDPLPTTDAAFRLTAYDCAAKTTQNVEVHSALKLQWKVAIEAVVDGAVDEYLHGTGNARRQETR